jgi:hypothetical protein
MPRKRTPSPEQQQQHRSAIQACATIVGVVAESYPGDVDLKIALRSLREFGESKVVTPRVRKPKAVEQPALV